MTDSSTTASADSSTTLRPRNRRRSNEENDVSTNWVDGSAVSLPASRVVSPMPMEHPLRPTRVDRKSQAASNGSRFLGVPSILGSQATPTNFATGLWESSWSSLQGIATNLIGNDSLRLASPGRSPQRHQVTEPPSRRNKSSPSTQWGPSGSQDRQLGAGTQDDRRALLQARKREALLAATDHTLPAASRRHKRRDSDERNDVSVPPGEDEGRDALVYLHKVKPQDTLAGVMIKYNCNPNVFRKANRLWPNDSIQIRNTVVLPVDACGVKGRRISEPNISSDATKDGSIGEIMPTPTAVQAPWADLHKPSKKRETPISSMSTSPSISLSLSNPEDPPWKHDSWVQIDGFLDAVEIARLSRRSLGYFPRGRRKSSTFTDLETPAASFDLPRASFQSNTAQEQRKTKSRSSSGSFLQGPGGVGTMGRNVRSPGPAQDGLNKIFAKHLPDVAPRSSFESVNSSSSYGNGMENIGGAVEGWVRKLAAKAANTVQPATPGGSSGIGDLIELSEDAFDDSRGGEDDLSGRRNTITSANAGSGVGAWTAEQERMLQERFPLRGRPPGGSSQRKDA